LGTSALQQVPDHSRSFDVQLGRAGPLQWWLRPPRRLWLRAAPPEGRRCVAGLRNHAWQAMQGGHRRLGGVQHLDRALACALLAAGGAPPPPPGGGELCCALHDSRRCCRGGGCSPRAIGPLLHLC
jgi:hypothetical protein